MPDAAADHALLLCGAMGGAIGEVGRAMGRELASLGINLSFAPVLDIHTNPNNPVIGDRAFGHNAGGGDRGRPALHRGA